MSFKLDPHVSESSTTTGTGALALTGVDRRFGDFLSDGDTTWYQARNRSVPAEWEEGIATWNTGHTLTRTTVLNSSNADAAVSFSAGTKDVICGLPSSIFPSGSPLGTIATQNANAVAITGGTIRLAPAFGALTVGAAAQDGTIITFMSGSEISEGVGDQLVLLSAGATYVPTIPDTYAAAFQFGFSTKSGNVQDIGFMAAVDGGIDHESSGTLEEAVGFRVSMGIASGGPGDVGEAVAFIGNVHNEGSGELGSGIVFLATTAENSGGGEFLEAYGLLVADQTEADANWAIKTGLGKVELGDEVIIAAHLEGAEITAPAAPGANGFRLFAQDNGAGKTQLMCLFASGAAQQIAIQP